MSVAQAQRQIEPVGHMDDIMGEERPILALLPVAGGDVARAFGDCRECAQAIAQARRDRARLRGRDGGRQAGVEEGGGEAGVEIGLGARDQRLGGEARAARGELRRGEIAGRAGARHQATGGEPAIVRAEADIVLQRQSFIGVIAAHQPVEHVAEGRALQPQFLGEGLELAEGIGIAIEKVGAVIIIVAIVAGLIVAIGGDAGELGRPEIIVDLARNAPILQFADIVAARRDAEFARIGIGGNDAALAGEDGGDAVEGRFDIAGAAAGKPFARFDIGRAAAAFVAIGIIADQADGERVGGFDQRLAAQEIAVAIIGVADRLARAVDQLVEAVALAPDAVQRQRDAVADGAGDAARQAPIIIAVGDLTLGVEGLFRRLADDVDEAGRSVAAEQGALRPAQHLDPFDFAQFVEASARARAIDAVDEHRDRAFQARIVADRADAADAGGRIGFGAGGGYEQRGGKLVERADVAGAAILHRLRAHGGHGDRDVGQRAGAAGGGDDDVGARIIGGRLRQGGVLRQRGGSQHAQRQRAGGGQPETLVCQHLFILSWPARLFAASGLSAIMLPQQGLGKRGPHFRGFYAGARRIHTGAVARRPRFGIGFP